MNDTQSLIRKCQDLGATLILKNNGVRVEAPKPLPDEFIYELRQSKKEIMAVLKKNHRQEADNWILEEWRKTSLPQWRRILKESIENKTKRREEYARWMLKEILQDPEYREEEEC